MQAGYTNYEKETSPLNREGVCEIVFEKAAQKFAECTSHPVS